MLQRFLDRFFYVAIIGMFFVLILAYVLVVDAGGLVKLDRTYFLFGVILVSISYLLRYRRKELLCFETIFFSLYILSVFFKELVLEKVLDDSTISPLFYFFFPTEVENKGTLLQSIGFMAFVIAAAMQNNKYYSRQVRNGSAHCGFNICYDFRNAIKILSILILGYILVLYFNGTIASWFHYSGTVSNYTNEAIVYLTILFLVLTVFQFSELNVRGCNGFSMSLRAVNRIYLFDLLVVSVLLLISGNRNEALLILIPPIIAYSVLIKKISNRTFLIGVVAGAIIMIVIGVTRQLGVSSEAIASSNISLFEATRDFGVVDRNTDYLIWYTDTHNPIMFKNAFLVLLSSVPFLGGVSASLFDIQSDMRSTEITTLGMQLQSNMDSGLGTSLIGDLYYTGSFPFVLVFMFFFGWLIAYLHNRFVVRKSYSMWLLLIYLYLMANVVYYIRAEWTMPLRYIGFSFVVALFFNIFFVHKRFRG